MSWLKNVFSVEKRQYCKIVTICGFSFEMKRKRTFRSLEQALNEAKYGWSSNQSLAILLNNCQILSSLHAPSHIRQELEILNYVTTLSPFVQEKLSRDEDYLWQKQMRELLHVMDVNARSDSFIRIGAPQDGGYVMFDEFRPGAPVYSFGIEWDVTWDTDMARRGLDIYMYDHTIDSLPAENERFHFFKTGITGETPLPHCKTLEELIRDNRHEDRNDLILKMDVEGCEWDVLNHVSEDTLNHFSQIVFELHGLAAAPLNREIPTALERLNRTHQLVYLHANNFGGVKWFGYGFLPMTLEATYVRRNDHSFVPTDKFFPTALDRPCNPQIPEVILGTWNAPDEKRDDLHSGPT